MDPFSTTFASGFASGINAYCTVLVLGLLGRFAHVGHIPAGFMRTDLLIVMAVLSVVDLVADKIPYFDSVWDSVNTIIRPIAGATIGALIAGANGDVGTVALASVGGVTALLSHVSKAGIRLAINTSPEPVSNISHSVAGDVTAASVASMAALFPIPAAIVAAILLIATTILAVLLFKTVRRGWKRLSNWYRRWIKHEPETARG